MPYSTAPQTLGLPPPLQAASASRKQLRQVLALPGLDLNARDPATGRTPLMLLAEARRALAVGDLLAYAAAGRVDLGARDSSGATAVLLAARAGDGVALQALLHAGAGAGAAGRTNLRREGCSDCALLHVLRGAGQTQLMSHGGGTGSAAG